jgi:pilus assembly protein TadC
MTQLMPPALEVLTRLRLEMQMGKSVARALTDTLEERVDSFSKALKVWTIRIGAGQESGQILPALKDLGATSGRRHFVAVLERGLRGSPIDENLMDLERELLFRAECRYEEYLQILPLKLLFPLAFFILPGVMLMLIGPILYEMRSGF